MLAIIFLSSCKKGEETEATLIRSADPCNAWARPGWQTGPGAVVTPELREGRASHLRPAEIIYYSILENSDSVGKEEGIFINPVLILTYLENASLLSKGKNYGDFELRLLQASAYGGEVMKKYHGFYPQLVAATYQWRAYQLKGLSFSEAQVLYPFTKDKDFPTVYAQIANLMNELCGTNFPLQPSSLGYFQDFYGIVTVADIQALLEELGSPLKGDLFKEAPLANSVINYQDLGDYCE